MPTNSIMTRRRFHEDPGDCCFVSLPLIVWADPKSLHDVPWYETHDAARVATLKLCHTDEASDTLRLRECGARR